jgi:opacity protein-like surface antigen
MKRYFLLAVSIVTLTVASHQLFAAELETPAPREGAAPAADRAAPAARRERAPAPERQAAPTRRRAPVQPQVAARPSQANWTGAQVGGYGGGNVGGGGFSDPALTTRSGIGCNAASSTPIISPSPSSSQPCMPGPGAQGSLPRGKVTAVGVLSFDTPKFAVPLGGGRVILIGAVIDVGTGSSTYDYTQSNTYSTAPPIGLDPVGQRTNETINFSFREGVNGSVRAKVGLPIFDYWAMLYLTAGVAAAKTEASYSYSATNFAPGCVPGAGCATNVFGSASFTQTRTGFSGGAGVEVQTGIPGIKVAFDYTYTHLGSISQTVPLVVTNCSIGAGLCNGGAEAVNFNHLSFQRATIGVKFGL